MMQDSLKKKGFLEWKKKDGEFASDRSEGTKDGDVVLHERESRQRGPERIKQWREAVWEEKNVNKVA